MITAIVGGAIMLICYLYIVYYGFNGSRPTRMA